MISTLMKALLQLGGVRGLMDEGIPTLSPPTVAWFFGAAFVYAGQRIWFDGALEWPITGLGLLMVFGVIGLAFAGRTAETDPGRTHSRTVYAGAGAIGLVAITMYFTTLDGFSMGVLGFDEAGRDRWYGAVTVIYLVTWVCSTFTLVFADRALAKHPKVLPVEVSSRSMYSGLATGLALCLIFPVNYLANSNGFEYDYAYFRTTKAGSSTLAVVRSLPEPVHATLFYTASNDVKEQLVPYFRSLQDASDGQFTYEVVDQAMVPDKAEELKIRDNGYISFAQGDNSEKFKVGTDIDRAKRDLKKLDGTVQKHLLKLAKGKRTAYMLTGHGEASARTKDNPTRKLNSFKKLMQELNYKVKDFAVSDGSADAVPDEAGLVIVAGPMHSLLPEELEALGTYLDGGGRLLILSDPILKPRPGEDPQPMASLLQDKLGLTINPKPLMNKTKFYPQRRGKYDRVLLHSNRYGSHASVKTLSRNSSQLHVLMPTVSGIEKTDNQPGKVSTLIRSYPDTWADENMNFERDKDEAAKVWDLAVAVEGGEGETEWRAIVVGDVNLFSDLSFSVSLGNKVFAADAVRWVV